MKQLKSLAKNYDATMSAFCQQGDTLESILQNVKAQYSALISEETMRNHLNTLYATEDNFFARLVPVFLKDIGLNVAEWYSGYENTASFSNIGRIWGIHRVYHAGD